MMGMQVLVNAAMQASFVPLSDGFRPFSQGFDHVAPLSGCKAGIMPERAITVCAES
jgi:hypothetical protein